jgi:three-Cys-motif partner protein
MTKKPIVYVDCFAGKGKFDDGNPGSPVIALEVRNRCLERSQSGNKQNTIECYFIDVNYASELQNNISKFRNYGTINVISGKYEEKIEGILSKNRDKNVFLYVDPYGIKALDSNRFDKFNAGWFNSFEMLINLNSFGFFRDACKVMKVDYNRDEALVDLTDLVEYEPTVVSASPQSEQLLTRVAGGDYWKYIVRDYENKKIDGYQAERQFSEEYKQQLREKYDYVLDMPIRLKPKNRPKYRMIHVCNHKDGCYLMAQNMLKRKEELFLNIQEGGQMSLFDIKSSVENEDISMDDVIDKLKRHLSQYTNDIRITQMIADFYTENGLLCELSMLHDALERLETENYVKVIRYPLLTKKTKKPTTFWEENDNHKVLIRRIC